MESTVIPVAPAFRSINAAFASNSVEAAFPTVIVRAVALVPTLIAPTAATVPKFKICAPCASILKSDPVAPVIDVVSVKLPASSIINAEFWMALTPSHRVTCSSTPDPVITVTSLNIKPLLLPYAVSHIPSVPDLMTDMLTFVIVPTAVASAMNWFCVKSSTVAVSPTPRIVNKLAACDNTSNNPVFVTLFAPEICTKLPIENVAAPTVPTVGFDVATIPATNPGAATVSTVTVGK